MAETKWQVIDADDIAAVVDVLKSDRLTCGQKVEQFELSFCQYIDIEHAVAVSSGTAALHAAMFALGLIPGDEVIVPTLTFVATVNAIVYMGAIPVFVDVEADTLLLDHTALERKITPKTKAIIAVDYAGTPCNYKAIAQIAKKYTLKLVADACHSLGASYYNNKVGALADLTVFSFHPVKSITTGEGGMVVTRDSSLASKMRRFRNHNMDADHLLRDITGDWQYDINELGFNYRLTDIQSALGISQLKKLDNFVIIRENIANLYRVNLSDENNINCLSFDRNIRSSNHFFVVKLIPNELIKNKKEIFKTLRDKNIAVNVHYKPVHLMSYYKNTYGYRSGMFPVAEEMYDKILTLPIHPSMNSDDVAKISEELSNSFLKYF